MRKHLFIILCALIFIVWYLPVAVPTSNTPQGYSTVPDADADYLVSLRVSRFEKLYSDFSILYPPGRFFVQGLLFYVMKPSFMVLSGWHGLVGLVLFPAALFVLVFYFFESLFTQHFPRRFQEYSSLLAFFFAVLSGLLYLSFFRSAQEIHLIFAVFLTVLLVPGKINDIKKFMLGLLCGLAFLFRIDGGILLVIALFVCFPRGQKIRFFLFGFLSVWLPVLILTLFHGSLFHFFYDTFVLGLIIQPKFMGLPIPKNELGKVWLSSLVLLTTTSLALFIDAANVKKYSAALRVVAVLSLVSYVAGLGRADEPHLWYGLIWMPILLIYLIYRVSWGFLKRERLSLPVFLFFASFILLFALLIIKLKSPNFFLVATFLLFLFFRTKKISVLTVLISGTIVSLLVFHSVSYLKLIYAFPSLPPPIQKVSAQEPIWQTKDRVILDEIRADIPPDEKYLFIFPKNVLLNEYFHLQNPTRYIILMNERSDRTEWEVIDQLNQTNTQYFLVFPESANLRKGLVNEWILENTQFVGEYQFETEKVELRKRKQTVIF